MKPINAALTLVGLRAGKSITSILSGIKSPVVWVQGVLL
jgi:hypothetical protein